MPDVVDIEIIEIETEIEIPGIAAYHLEIEEIYRTVDPASISAHPDADELIRFNGYYALNSANGAFFAIDTNFHVKPGSQTPIVDISLLVSLDGSHSFRFPFSGSFDGTWLRQVSAAEEGFSIEMEFTRAAGTQAYTATCAGSITLPGKLPKSVAGITYNNAIPYSTFEGIYYPSSFTGAPSGGGTGLPVAQIGGDWQLSYDGGSGDGQLKPVPSYTYNLNMYYFSFGPKDATVNLIMGTAAGKGLACNNMYADPTTKQLVSRALTTIPGANSPTNTPNNPNAAQLAALSGYYQLPSLAPGAFLSIQGAYVVQNGVIASNTVEIAISLDGVSSQTFYFDDTMTFANNELQIGPPAVPGNVAVTFSREYDAAHGALVSLAGTIDGQAVSGFTRFNPVPLSAFGGVPLTDLPPATDTLVIESDTQVTYNGVPMTDGTYVPIMYILASLSSNFMMSFGTAGLKGNACIVMPLVPTPGSTTKLVYAIPNAAD